MNIANIFNKINDIIETKKEETKLYNELLTRSLKFTNLTPLKQYNPYPSEGAKEEILYLCPNLNYEQAKIINSLIPLQETYLKIIYITQKIDNQYFIIIFTDKYLWILNNTSYTVMYYQNITTFDIISKSLMTQIVNFNNIIIGIDTTQNNLNEIYNLIKDNQYKETLIKEKTKYLCGIIPTYQQLNKINSGLSIDNNKNIVFHDKKINNYIYNYQDIQNYEILEDNIVVLKKKTNDPSHHLTSVKQTCTNINLRITLKNNQTFIIPLLEPTTFNSIYNHNDTIYLNNFKFAKEIINILDSLEPKLY